MINSSPHVVDVRAMDVGYFSVKLSLGRKLVDGDSVIHTGLFPSLAPRLPSGMSLETAMKSKTDGCVVNVNGVSYYVGRDAILYSSGREPRAVLPNYSNTDKYRALFLGGLHYIAQDVGVKGDLILKHLVLGLPLNNYANHYIALTKMAEGTHELPDPRNSNAVRCITVQSVSVVVQPQGALTNYAVQNQTEARDGWTLVVDPGGGTLDWFVSRGRQPNWQRSGAYPKSMLECSYAVADAIDRTWRDNFEIIERIDRAIREGAPSVKTAGRTHELARYASAIEAVVKEATDKMVAGLGSMDNLDRILFTGGGARLFYEYMVVNYPDHKNIMHIDNESVFANVKGFQLVGEFLTACK